MIKEFIYRTMKPGNFHKIILCAIVILSAEILSAQIIKTPDPKLVIDRTKGILVINPCISGSFYLNDYYLTDISVNDTVYIYNLKSGDYAVKFITDTSSYTGDLTIHTGKVQAIIPCNDSLSTGKEILNWNQAIRKMTGKTLAPVRVKR